MEFVNLIKDAELDMFFMSGRGLGAVLLAIVALAVVFRSKSGEMLIKGMASVARSFRGDK